MARIRGGRNLEARFLGSIAYIGGRRGRGASMAFRSRTGHVRGVNDERQKERYRVYTRVRLLFEFLIAFFSIFCAGDRFRGRGKKEKKKKKIISSYRSRLNFQGARLKLKFSTILFYFSFPFIQLAPTPRIPVSCYYPMNEI